MSFIKTRVAKFVAGAAIIVAAAGAASAASPIDMNNSAFAPVIGPTSIPIGHAQFCKVHNEECGPYARIIELVTLTEERWEELVRTNNRMNSEIVPITDEDLYQVGEFWTYPDGYGDCEDIALAKRRALIEAGWDPSALLMAVVRERNGAGHAVLMVRTDRGDLILDNQDGMVRLWSETNYQFVKRQSQTNAGEWVLIDDTRPVVTVASTNN
jgi:predicted transglutaminase-like cysteine proteinase